MPYLSRLLLLLCLSCSGLVGAEAMPSEKLLTALQRGVSLPIWFTYRGQTGIDPARGYPDAADWRQIKALGFVVRRVRRDAPGPAAAGASLLAG